MIITNSKKRVGGLLTLFLLKVKNMYQIKIVNRDKTSYLGFVHDGEEYILLEFGRLNSSGCFSGEKEVMVSIASRYKEFMSKMGYDYEVIVIESSLGVANHPSDILEKFDKNKIKFTVFL